MEQHRDGGRGDGMGAGRPPPPPLDPLPAPPTPQETQGAVTVAWCGGLIADRPAKEGGGGGGGGCSPEVAQRKS